ncbi:16S rRNA (uracil(1498)-N(3))-methyltransferase [Carboxydothermus hydrogenoformans]|uniref:Ribosomal RNA small subunit methyltransferase E n=1 Tax=Carboxydothermus hydrogenoformans (strain ATCC BAA-161 / DSM 6008 / Z-2901) TaxID=246194 RepID=Q3AF05_CARHZ|nr:16S rRNA (uracil(1498)-N(3))-methyltransferase [Carboxydothermus hydrogenoformans]ABB15107.1 conserved hypothetical protein TIGR00046 [Carboxydothermus hydrogenoformans Z-2901]
MPYFFLPPGQTQGDYAYLTGDDAKHVAKVLRIKPGEKLTLQDDQEFRYLCQVIAVRKDLVQLKILEKKKVVTRPPVNVTLVQGVPKGDKMDFIVQKATELGVYRIIPVETIRTVVVFDERKKKDRCERWQKIAYEAAKQAGVSRVPEIFPVIDLKALPEFISDALILVPYEGEEQTSLKQLLNKEAVKNVTVIIGPEGGFDPGEIEYLKSFGAVTVSLGPRILRTETAALAVLSMVLYQWGDLGGELR